MAELQSELPFNRYEPSDHVNHDYGIRARKAAKNYEMFRAKNEGFMHFGEETNLRNEDGSGYCSPPLWKTGTETRLDYKYLSADAKSQAVARGQRELMEMIKNMPESDYELTLKDLVEHQDNKKAVQGEDETNEYWSSDALITKEVKRNNSSRDIYKKKRKVNNSKKVDMRSRSINNGGFLLKMGLPFSFGFGAKKKANPKATGLVSPKPPPPVVDGGGKGVDKEWWKKRSSGSGGSESLGMSNNSGSTGSSGSSNSSRSSRSINRDQAGFGSGCLSIFCFTNSKSPKQ